MIKLKFSFSYALTGLKIKNLTLNSMKLGDETHGVPFKNIVQKIIKTLLSDSLSLQ